MKWYNGLIGLNGWKVHRQVKLTDGFFLNSDKHLPYLLKV